MHDSSMRMGRNDQLLWVLIRCYACFLLLTISVVQSTNFSSTNRISKAGCQSQCGKVTIIYPFGIGLGSGCAIDPWFEVTCNTSFNPPKPFFSSGIEIFEISNNQLRVSTKIVTSCYNSQVGRLLVHGADKVQVDLRATPYIVSGLNRFTIIGCNDFGLISGDCKGRNFSSGCGPICPQAEDGLGGDYSGIGCCETSFPEGAIITHCSARLGNFNNHSTVYKFNPCSYGFLAEQGRFVSGGTFDFFLSEFH
ncbi:OLC1v1024999C1 [Oldenlandia corymbosa var. corymbosa]|uniref:OLC1v1024999C1 n=1 Tax=Oldenlandia corymbosa var. corymbosa TaxID=529605 RepID=A0AAV1C4F2_OLDCO|nr:OLC1v1024999C1 [Oldenlandia corymbosa var. corymbosa]